MSKKKKKHTTTKNTVPKVTGFSKILRLQVISGECNGAFTLVTDFPPGKEFDEIYHEWFDHPDTHIWCVESLIVYIKMKQPNRICLTQEHYDKIIEGKGVIPSTREEWLQEQN